MNSRNFEIPVVVFFFKRVEKTVEIIKAISLVKPSKIYLVADGGRNDDEKLRVNATRAAVEEAIDWDCEIIKNYADENAGVFDRIGNGSRWVLERERYAIFLEDDNLPDVTFFHFCREMLYLYESDTRILWICGTNYLGEFESLDSSSYLFSHHLLPCGWASWRDKFNKFYDENMDALDDPLLVERIKRSYMDRKLLSQDLSNWNREKRRIINKARANSWDYQMSLTVRSNGFYGIVPKSNLIKNIGVDMDSTHGGVSLSNVMTRRFCEIETKPLEFPLVHPKLVWIDPIFEKKLGEIILFPFRYRLMGFLNRFVKIIFFIPIDVRLRDHFSSMFRSR